MFIVWGTRTFKKILGNAEMYTCDNCNNANEFQVVRTAQWFTLFWIPIFPFSNKYFIMCQMQYSMDLSITVRQHVSLTSGKLRGYRDTKTCAAYLNKDSILGGNKR